MQCLEAAAPCGAAPGQVAACNGKGCKVPGTAAPLQLMQARGIYEARLEFAKAAPTAGEETGHRAT